MELEELLKKHTDNVGTALAEFKGKVGSIEDLVNALQKRTDEAEAKANRFLLGGGSPTADNDDVTSLSISGDERKYMGAVLKGKNPDPIEFKTTSMQTATESDGGYLIPDQLRGQMEKLIKKQSPVRQVARVVPIGASDKFPISGTGTEAGWVGENDDRPQTNSPKIEGVQLPGGTLYALPQASEEVIDDCILNLEAFIQDSVIDVMAEKESIAFINGDGIKKPRGFLSSPFAATSDDTRALGTLQYVPTGFAGDFGSAMIDTLVAIMMAVKAGYRQAPGCGWMASTDMLAAIAKLKDSQGRPIFLPSTEAGLPGMLLGYPVTECEHMAAVAANAFPIAFGNWQRGYVIGDRTSLNVLRDPYTTKGAVKWYFRRRVHGSVLNSEAIKAIKVAVS
jgi:HK97 family phage major capsid protein